VIEQARPSEIYNLGAQSFVGTSFDQPETTTGITGLGTLHLLEAIRTLDRSIRYYQASSAEMFGLVQATPQSETTPFYPRSPYAVAKLYAHWMTVNYRESYDIFGSCGILFNHESPLRGLDFVTRKITDGVARIALGDPAPIRLGNLNAERDWGYAPEYVAGMWSMLQAERADTFVFATNKTNSVRSFVEWAFQAVDIDVEWRGAGLSETGICRDTGRLLVEVSPAFYRPAEVDRLIGDASKAARVIGWYPSTPVRELCAKMVAADLERHYRRRASQSATLPYKAPVPAAVITSSANRVLASVNGAAHPG
jgi:GDPmannose 4,6-dehydratase